MNNNNEVDAVVQEALKVHEQRKPPQVGAILENYRLHIEDNGLTKSARFTWSNNHQVLYENEQQAIKRWFENQGYRIQFEEWRLARDGDRFLGYEVSIAKLM